MIDLVVPIEAKTRNEKVDVKYLLRSFEKNFKELGNVWIITSGNIDWIQNAKVLQYDDMYRHNKDANLIGKVYYTCMQEGLSSHFVRASDDQVLLRPMVKNDFKNYGFGDMRHITIQNSNWQQRFYATRDILLKEKKPCINYETHMPMLMQKDKYMEIMTRYAWWVDRHGYTINSLYFNNCFDKMYDDANLVKFSCEKEMPLNELMRHIQGKYFLGYGEKTRTLVHGVLKNMFPNKSRYEK